MQLAKLLDILEREMPGIGDKASTRANLGRLYAERGHHDEAAEQLRLARQASTDATVAASSRRRPR
jgi:uncharacterized protein HemY